MGTNLTIECLKRVLESCMYSRCVIPVILDDRKPRKLYLQLDNTARQNKSKYLFTYLAWLVQTEQVQEVIVSFLPVGHPLLGLLAETRRQRPPSSDERV